MCIFFKEMNIIAIRKNISQNIIHWCDVSFVGKLSIP